MEAKCIWTRTCHLEVSKLASVVGYSLLAYKKSRSSQNSKYLSSQNKKVSSMGEQSCLRQKCINTFRECCGLKTKNYIYFFKILKSQKSTCECDFIVLTVVAAVGFDTNGRLLNVKSSRYRSHP